jgi:hypothetical protein
MSKVGDESDTECTGSFGRWHDGHRVRSEVGLW